MKNTVLPQPPRAKAGRKKNRDDKQLSLFGLNNEALQYVSGLRQIKKKNEIMNWNGIDSIPPGTLIDDILREFHIGTSLPLELPFSIFLHVIAGYLLKNNVIIQFRNQKMFCDFWTILLSPSASGKTWTKNKFKEAFLSDIDDIAFEINACGSAAFLMELQKHSRGLWIRDEILQLLQQITNPQGSHAETYDYLLRLYDNETLERVTRKDTIKVENPAIALLGLNTPDTFMEAMSPKSLTDGFAQRYSYTLTQPEPDDSARSWRKMPDWFIDTTDWADKWKRMTENLQNVYTVSESGIEAYRKIYLTYSENTSVNESFFRRVLWKLHKYALVYHLINFRAADSELDETDYFWAQRLIERQLTDAYKIINGSSQGRIGKLLDKAEEWIKKTVAAGKIPTARNLARNFSRDINSINEAEAIIKMLYRENNLKTAQSIINTNVVAIK